MPREEKKCGYCNVPIGRNPRCKFCSFPAPSTEGIREWEEELRLRVNFDKNQDREVCILFIQRLLSEKRERMIEFLDELAFESDDGYKVEIFINWDEARKKLKVVNLTKENI